MKPPEFIKAIIGAVIAGLTALSTALGDGNLSTAEVVTVIVAFFVAGGAVYGVPNKPAAKPVTPLEHKAAPSPNPPEAS
ncbi:MAG: hypothetical protein ACRDP4_12750 [Nocardioidaceae bacterium]